MADFSGRDGREPKVRRIGRMDLALVVGCLGLAAAFAIPQQQSQSAHSQRLEASALAASLRSAAGLGHQYWQEQGAPEVIDTTKGPVRMSNGYPVAGDIARLLDPAEVMAFQQAGGEWQHRERSGGEPCGVTYAPPGPDAREPVVRLRVRGC